MSNSVSLSPSTENPDQAAHEAAMIAKVDEAAAKTQKEGNPQPLTAEPTAEERPEWLDEKFEKPEDLAKAYKELQAKLGEKKPEAPAEETAEQKAAREAAEAASPVKPDATTEQAEAALKDVGLDYNKFSTEIVENGELSAESYAELEGKGIPKSVVDQYIEGQRAVADKAITEAQAIVGGAEKYSELMVWADANLSAGEKAAFDKAVTTSNMDQAKLAIAGLYARFQGDVGKTPDLLNGNPPGESTDVYLSNKQVTADMKTDLYKTDPAERARVEAKIARSPKVL